MSLETGTVSFHVFYLRAGTQGPADVLAAMAAHGAPDLERAEAEKPAGWVGPDHLLDRDLSAEHCVCGDWLHVQLMQAERKVPESLLKAACKAEEKAELLARGADYLPRVIRAEIKQRVTAELRAKAQPTLSGIGVWLNLRQSLMLAEATNDSKIDWISPAVKEVTGSLPIVATPETAAIVLEKLNANDVGPVVYSPDRTLDTPREVSLGMEFLTFLFWRYERDGGAFRLDLHGPEMGYMLEGPLTFWREGMGAHEVSIRKGNPLNSQEAIACLSAGKLLRKAKLVLADADKTWTAVVDDTFVFQGVKLPKEEQADPHGRRQEREMHMVTFITAWFALYKEFLKLRADAKAWGTVADEIREWIGGRNSRD